MSASTPVFRLASRTHILFDALTDLTTTSTFFRPAAQRIQDRSETEEAPSDIVCPGFRHLFLIDWRGISMTLDVHVFGAETPEHSRTYTQPLVAADGRLLNRIVQDSAHVILGDAPFIPDSDSCAVIETQFAESSAAIGLRPAGPGRDFEFISAQIPLSLASLLGAGLGISMAMEMALGASWSDFQQRAVVSRIDRSPCDPMTWALPPRQRTSSLFCV